MIEGALVKGLLERVPADPERAVATIEEARRHLASAEVVVSSDPNGAYQLLYDAARKAVMAHMLAAGLRVTKRPGSHETTARYAAAALQTASAVELNRMRLRRNRSEYELAFFDEAELEAGLAHARDLVEMVATELSL